MVLFLLCLAAFAIPTPPVPHLDNPLVHLSVAHAVDSAHVPLNLSPVMPTAPTEESIALAVTSETSSLARSDATGPKNVKAQIAALKNAAVERKRTAWRNYKMEMDAISGKLAEAEFFFAREMKALKRNRRQTVYNSWADYHIDPKKHNPEPFTTAFQKYNDRMYEISGNIFVARQKAAQDKKDAWRKYQEERYATRL